MSKITGYAALSATQADDVLPIVDVHDTSMAPDGTTKKITVAALTAGLGALTAANNLSDVANAATARGNLGAAQDSAVVHLAATETITGAKTFSVPPNLATQSISGTATLAAASAPVVLTDTAAAAFTLTLPAAPVTGEFFIVADSTGQWNTHNLTVGRNGKNIDGAAANLTLVNQWGKVWLYYDGAAWWALAAGVSNETPVALGPAAAGTHNSPSRADHVHPTTGLVTSVAAGDASIAVGGTSAAPTVVAGTLDVIAANHPPAANWPNNSKKITSLANGSAAQDAAAFGQIPLVDATAAHILADGIQAAGANGQWADSGHVHQNNAVLSLYTEPAGTTAVTFPRGLATVATGAMVSGTLYVVAIPLPKGLVVSNLTLATKSTAAVTIAHGWYVLLDPGLVVRAVTADQAASGTWLSAVNTPYTLAAASPYTTTAAGLYYAGIMIAATTMPNMAAAGTMASGLASASPVLCGTSSTGQTTPPATGTTMGALTAAGSFTMYAATS